MNKPSLFRSIAALIGAAVLFGLELGLDVAFYIAIPAAILVYTGCRLGFAMLTPDTPAK
jgi:hypothetical protein